MKHVLLSLSLLAGVSVPALAAPAAEQKNQVELNYENPDKFTDFARHYSAVDGADEGYMKELRKYFVRRASKHLAPGQRLSVTITDVDMAGDFEPQHGPTFNDVRIIKDIYPPRIELKYTLTDANGTIVAQGQRNLTNLAYKNTISPIRNEDPLRYEKELVDDFVRDLGRKNSATE